MTDTLKTDRIVYPEPPPPPLPAAGGTLADPTFGTTILRVTDERDGADNKNAYSYWPSLNCNNSRLFYLSGAGNVAMVADFDAAAFTVKNKRQLFTTSPPGGGWPNAEDAIWSGVDPDVIFCRTGMRLLALNVRTNAYTVVADLTGKAGAAANLQQMSKSPDDQVFGFNIQDANWTRLGCLAWNRRTGDLYTYFGTVDEVQVDKTGQWLMVMTGQQGQGVVESKVVNLATRQSTDLMDGAPDYSPGHKDCGRGTVYGEDNWINRINGRRLDSPHACQTILDFGTDWSMGKHVGLAADDDSWLLVSTFVANGLASSGLFKNELVLVSTDGQQRVRRLCHHHSNLLGQYWNSPRADLSHDGQFAVFTSNWGSSTRRDVFVVRIPPVSAPPPVTPPGDTVDTMLTSLIADLRAGKPKPDLLKQLALAGGKLAAEI